MLKYCDWIKLHESLGSVTLGMGGPQNMGLHGLKNRQEVPNDEDTNDLEDSDEDENPEDMDDSDEDNPDSDEGEGDEEGEEGDVDDQIGDEDSGEDDEDEGMMKKKSPMGDYHDDSPFMKKENCDSDEDSDDEDGEDGEDGAEKDSQDDKQLAFMQKKGMKSGKKKMKKKCSSDMEGKEVKMCAKCKGMKSEKVKKENTEKDFLSQLQKTHDVGKVKRYSDGMNEDMLILPPEVKEMSFESKPGEVGHSPETRLGLTESFSELLKKAEKLENKFKK